MNPLNKHRDKHTVKGMIGRFRLNYQLTTVLANVFEETFDIQAEHLHYNNDFIKLIKPGKTVWSVSYLNVK